jgi:hypothetical protein
MKPLISLVLACALMGCATGTKIQSVDEGLGAAELQVAALGQSEASARKSGVLTQAQGTEALSLFDQATTALAAGRAAEKTGDMTTAQGKLTIAVSLLAQLSAYLTAHGVK